MPKSEHPLREIRRQLMKSRPQFAAMLGVTEHTIKRIETGRLSLSEKLAERMFLAMGVRTDELSKGMAGHAIDASGQPFTREWFDHWQRIQVATMGDVEKLTEASVGWTRLLLEVAAERGRTAIKEPMGQKLHQQVRSAVGRALSEIADEFNLTESIQEELVARAEIRKDPEQRERMKRLAEMMDAMGKKPWRPKIKLPRKLADDEVISIKPWEPISPEPPPPKPPSSLASRSRASRA